jgi:hypothetical protein
MLRPPSPRMNDPRHNAPALTSRIGKENGLNSIGYVAR